MFLVAALQGGDACAHRPPEADRYYAHRGLSRNREHPSALPLELTLGRVFLLNCSFTCQFHFGRWREVLDIIRKIPGAGMSLPAEVGLAANREGSQEQT